MSDLGLLAMGGTIAYWIRISDLATVTKFYIIPYLLANHWIVMLTYLHHTDPTMPHFRKDAWTFVRGAITTIDRPLLGWAGRFFLHNVSHDHVAHHLVSSIPHCKNFQIYFQIVSRAIINGVLPRQWRACDPGIEKGPW